jgi:hypothetical protein
MAANSGPKSAPPVFSQFAVELTDGLQRTAETYLEEFDEHHAFDYLIAELLATTNPGHFTFTDGPNDGGIDFFVKEGASYTICQCKCVDIATLSASTTAPTFDDKAIDEITSAIRMLLDPEGKYKISSKIKMLRTDYQRDQREDTEARLLTAILAISGELTPSARTKFSSEQASLKKNGVTLRLVTWNDIYRTLHFQELDTDSINFDLTCDDVKKELLRFQDYCYVLAHAHDFYDAFRQHEWNLFDLNVRLQLTNSAINGKIVTTLLKEKSRKRFHHYNNGILITCSNYKIDEKKNLVRLNGAQIINGCQTVRAICEAYEDLEPSDQDNFRKAARVQVKIIKNTDPEFIGQLTITTNDQNPMNPRNLKSNSSEQKGIQNAFRIIRPVPWFYERKDGEFRSYLSASTSVRWFRKSDYAAVKTRYRKIENSELAKIWYSFIGFSDRTVHGGIDFFEDEVVYSQIFKRTPNDKFWHEFAANAHFSPDDDWFEIGDPPVHAYLLAFVISKYIDAKTLNPRQNKDDAIDRGVSKGFLRRDGQGRLTSTEEDVTNFLAEDDEYRLNIMLGNMKDIMVELSALVLSARYGNIDAQLANRILTSPELQTYVTSACSPEEAPDGDQNGSKIIGPTFQFLKYCTKQYFYANQAEIQAAARMKAYLWQRKVVNKMRENVLKLSPKITDYDVNWKPRGTGFFESLPQPPM